MNYSKDGRHWFRDRILLLLDLVLLGLLLLDLVPPVVVVVIAVTSHPAKHRSIGSGHQSFDLPGAI